MKTNVGDALIHTLKKSDLENLFSNSAEYALDQLLENDALKEIPVFSTIMSLIKVGIGIREQIFYKKLFKFLCSISDVSCEDRRRMIDRLENDTDFNQNVGEHIVLLLDRMDDLHKPSLMGRAFKAYLDGKISGKQLQQINFGIDRIFSYNLPELKKFYSKEFEDDRANANLEPIVVQNLGSCGFVDFSARTGGGVFCTKNELGRIFTSTILRGHSFIN